MVLSSWVTCNNAKKSGCEISPLLTHVKCWWSNIATSSLNWPTLKLADDYGLFSHILGEITWDAAEKEKECNAVLLNWKLFCFLALAIHHYRYDFLHLSIKLKEIQELLGFVITQIKNDFIWTETNRQQNSRQCCVPETTILPTDMTTDSGRLYQL